MNKQFYGSAAKKIAVTAMFMALEIVLSLRIFTIPTPIGNFYFNDVLIVIASILLDPVSSFIACGVGAFLGDVLFYPAAMFVSLVTRGLQAVAISLISHYAFKNKPLLSSIIAAVVGAVIAVLGYTFGKIFFYSTMEYAMMKLPLQIAMSVSGAVLGIVVCYPLKIKNTYEKIFCKKA